MPDEDNNFDGPLVWILENDDVTYNPTHFLGQYNIFAVDNRECNLSYYLFYNKKANINEKPFVREYTSDCHSYSSNVYR